VDTRPDGRRCGLSWTLVKDFAWDWSWAIESHFLCKALLALLAEGYVDEAFDGPILVRNACMSFILFIRIPGFNGCCLRRPGRFSPFSCSDCPLFSRVWTEIVFPPLALAIQLVSKSDVPPIFLYLTGQDCHGSSISGSGTQRLRRLPTTSSTLSKNESFISPAVAHPSLVTPTSPIV